MSGNTRPQAELSAGGLFALRIRRLGSIAPYSRRNASSERLNGILSSSLVLSVLNNDKKRPTRRLPPTEGRDTVVCARGAALPNGTLTQPEKPRHALPLFQKSTARTFEPSPRNGPGSSFHRTGELVRAVDLFLPTARERLRIHAWRAFENL
jgi:hypothetical protein